MLSDIQCFGAHLALDRAFNFALLNALNIYMYIHTKTHVRVHIHTHR